MDTVALDCAQAEVIADGPQGYVSQVAAHRRGGFPQCPPVATVGLAIAHAIVETGGVGDLIDPELVLSAEEMCLKRKR